MRQFPDLSDSDVAKEVIDLKADQWQLNALKMNPSYVSWGNYEDYMTDKDAGWRSPIFLNSWSEHWDLDEYNELVNFYFNVERKSHNCPVCEGSNMNPVTKQISDDWYDFAETGRKWSKNISDVEVEALVKHGRLWDLTKPTKVVDNPEVTSNRYFFDKKTNKWMAWINSENVEVEQPEYPTANEVNQWAKGKGLGHDAINQWICVETRAKHLGVYGHCSECEGGVVYDVPKATLQLQLWFILPRKGASRGVLIDNILEEDLPSIKAYLKEASERNAQRFQLESDDEVAQKAFDKGYLSEDYSIEVLKKLKYLHVKNQNFVFAAKIRDLMKEKETKLQNLKTA